MKFCIDLPVLVFVGALSVLSLTAEDAPRACRSVHLAFPSEEGTAFYNEVAVQKSSSGTYFMACGFSKGYFGIQELGNGKKIVLFSVWEPGKQNNPNATPEERRVKEIAAGKDVRVKRFGGEGTGGQSFYDYDWKIGQTCRFVVYAKPEGERTQYAGYFYVAEENRWQHMATFSTLADKHLLRGYYSFVEDFRRNGESAKQHLRLDVGNGWAKIGDQWKPLVQARFTADQTPTENIDAGSLHDQFFLATGGETKNEHEKLWSKFAIADAERKPPLDLPDPFGDGSIANRRLRILSYNIKHGRGNDNKVDLNRAAMVIRRLNPDIVALQEIDNKVDRSGKVDEPEFLSKATGLNHHAFGSFFDFGGGQYGMAMLSRFPIVEHENLRLPAGTEPRSSLVARIQLDKDKSLTVADVHFYQTQDQRSAQAKTLLDHLAGIKGDAVIAGDFNSTPDSPVMKLFEKDWIIPAKGEDHFTFHSAKPDREIDFAMVRRSGSYKIDAIDVIEEPVISDHRPLVMEISKLKQSDDASSIRASDRFEVSETKSEVKLTATDDSLEVSVRKTDGIDSLTLTRKQMRWPKSVTVALSTSGLENLTLSSGGRTISGEISSQHGHRHSFTSKVEEEEAKQIDRTDADWPNVSIQGPAKSIPLENGYFEIHVPATLLTDDDPTLRISWIDFYR